VRFKLDGNLGHVPAEQLRAGGHDVSTVRDEAMQEASEQTVLDAARRERRCLVTLDVEFGNPLVFRPAAFPGIVIIRLPSAPTPEFIIQAVATLLRPAGPKLTNGPVPARRLSQPGSVRLGLKPQSRQ